MIYESSHKKSCSAKFADELIQDDIVCEDAFENAMTNLVAQLLVDLDWVLRSSGMTAVS